jgi:hypothetical protein
VVHGGGKQLSELATKLGIEQTIIEGRRVTDDATLEMAKMIFAGKINTDILAALRQRGIEAVGLSGVDGNIVHAERRPPKEILNRETGERAQVDFGHVGGRGSNQHSTAHRSFGSQLPASDFCRWEPITRAWSSISMLTRSPQRSQVSYMQKN